jgi:hypothetical protein
MSPWSSTAKGGPKGTAEFDAALLQGGTVGSAGASLRASRQFASQAVAFGRPRFTGTKLPASDAGA